MNQEQEQLIEALDSYFSRGIDKKKFIDTNRIPLICQDISHIHEEMKELKADVKDISGNIKWFVRLILGAVFLGLLGLLIKSNL